MGSLRWLGVLWAALLGPACSDDPKGLQLGVGIPNEAGGRVSSITVTLRGAPPLGDQDHDWDESAVHIHPEEGRLDLSVDARNVDLTSYFDLFIVPSGNPIDVNISAQAFDAAGDLLADNNLLQTVHFDPSSLTRANLDLGCKAPRCAPIPIGQVDVLAEAGSLLWKVTQFEAHLWTPDEKMCSGSGHGLLPPGLGPAMQFDVHRFSKAQHHAIFTLTAGNAYTVYLRGFDDDGQFVAAGCVFVATLPAHLATPVRPDMGLPDELHCLNPKAGCSAHRVGSQ